MRQKVDAALADLTAEVIANIENDPGNWTQPWKDALGNGFPINVLTRKRYQGGNVMVLSVTAMLNGWPQNVWGTYKQWQGLEGQVKKGEKGTLGLFWKIVEKEDKETGETRTFPILNGFWLFNVSQVEGGEQITKDRFGDGLNGDVEPITRAEEFFAEVGADVTHALQDQAFYSPTRDTITLPLREQFDDANRYYATLAHEHVHWTGHSTRCNRQLDKSSRFGDDPYAKEELVAELGAVFVGGYLGLDVEPLTHSGAQYLQHWLKVLKEDSKVLWNVLSLAGKAFEWLVEEAGENGGSDDEQGE